nr:MAG TPA: hypothetical protein [Caudoviricetes sp.]
MTSFYTLLYYIKLFGFCQVLNTNTRIKINTCFHLF